MFPFSQSRIVQQHLVDLCFRTATSLRAGVDARTSWKREADHAPQSAAAPIRLISDAVNRGETLTEALRETGEFFPQMFRELVEVGEQTGHLPEVFEQLGSHYQHRIDLQRSFRSAITWPVIQLCLALCVVALLIWFAGFMAPRNRGKPVDLLGLGLAGEEGLTIYGVFLASVAIAGFILYRQIRRGALWTGPAQILAMEIPKIGAALQSLCLSRFCWSLRLTLDTAMPVQRALQLAFSATHNAYYTRRLDDVLLRVRNGQEITETLDTTSVFPRDLLNALSVGEQTGRMPETLAVLSESYQQEARRATRVLTQAAGYLVWAMVAGLIIMMIFRLASFYTGMINDAAAGRF